ncbi:hypothetical protein FS749_003800 [Ceratobasidium sp. UAMH 11750]|nr:hypothetical protein FS749_003800 [Ceratobasidium sp. UAMH 11750]
MAAPSFPWNNWADHLDIASWAYDELMPPEAVDVTTFSGVFALSDIELSYSHYWVTFAMINMECQDLMDDAD